MGAVRINDTLDPRRFSDAIITDAGDIFGWTGPSEIAALNVWGAGDDLSRSLDKIFKVELLIPPRPTISNMQWLSGTTYITPADMDKLSKSNQPSLNQRHLRFPIISVALVDSGRLPRDLVVG